MAKHSIEDIISLTKRRGFIFQSSDIYGGFAGVYDYGPYGVELANNLKATWWKYMVQLRPDIVGLDSGIFMHPAIWKASGHVDGFSDPLAECKNCHHRIRVDHILEELGEQADEKMTDSEIGILFDKHRHEIKCPKCGKIDFSAPKSFNLLVKSNIGNFSENWIDDVTYLRGETCQGIYVNFPNIVASTRVRIPFGIAQIGKAFRNEISPRQFIFRTRELEQMEMQYFTHPDDEMTQYEKLREYRWDFYKHVGINEENLRWHRHENLVFYAREAYDIEYNFPFGFKELEGVHARGNYDLTQHQKGSSKDLGYSDPQSNEKYIPHIIESSIGVGRLMLAVLTEAYTEDEVNGEKRIVLKIHPSIAPVKAAVFPLLKNRPELVKKAKEVYEALSQKFMCEFDDNGNVGKRYRRQDEIGTPYCITIDFDTLEDDTVTIRDRDTTEQRRVKIADLEMSIVL
ncbi:glycine--tRNA ligase [Candidatus Saccharibacteria bacterium]|nr:MAG: glycine--tRNA ligase [Candidatus Saccharibacteria bacterium]